MAAAAAVASRGRTAVLTASAACSPVRCHPRNHQLFALPSFPALSRLAPGGHPHLAVAPDPADHEPPHHTEQAGGWCLGCLAWRSTPGGHTLLLQPEPLPILSRTCLPASPGLQIMWGIVLLLLGAIGLVLWAKF